METGELKPEDFITLSREVISNAPQGIEDEFTRSPNPWMACFKGHLDPLDIYLSFAKKKGQISEEDYKKLDNKIEALKNKSSIINYSISH